MQNPVPVKVSRVVVRSLLDLLDRRRSVPIKSDDQFGCILIMKERVLLIEVVVAEAIGLAVDGVLMPERGVEVIGFVQVVFGGVPKRGGIVEDVAVDGGAELAASHQNAR